MEIRTETMTIRTYLELKEYARVESTKRGWYVSQFIEWLITEHKKGGK